MPAPRDTQTAVKADAENAPVVFTQAEAGILLAGLLAARSLITRGSPDPIAIMGILMAGPALMKEAEDKIFASFPADVQQECKDAEADKTLTEGKMLSDMLQKALGATPAPRNPRIPSLDNLN